MKDFICVSCWTSFQVDEATLAAQSNVTCPKCKAVQPTSTTAVASSVMEGADDTLIDDDVDGAAILGMLGDLGPSEPKGVPPLGPPTRATVSFMAASPGSGGGFAEVWPPPPGSDNDGSHGWSLPGEEPEMSLGTLDRSIEDFGRAPDAAAAFPSPAGFSSPSAPLVQEDDLDEDLGWRIKLASGLVLSFPTIDMVTAWAKDKDAESVEISYGTEEFQAYALFQERYAQVQHPVDAFFGRVGRATSPHMAAAAHGLPTAAGSSVSIPGIGAGAGALNLGGPGPTAADEDYVPDPAAVAAAAASDKQFKSAKMYQQKFQFRTAPEPSGMPKILIIILTLVLLGGATVGLLMWQGII